MEKILITTPIYYVNDRPHIGHAYTTIAADVLTRFFRLQGKQVFFLTGTDEHGAKVADTAEKLGKSPKDFCDENSEKFKQVWSSLGIKYDYFIRTTDERHEQAVKKFVDKLKQKGAIYEKEYEGLYCKGCEKFLLEKDLSDGVCPDHQTKPEKISEKNYFFKLEEHLKQVGDLIKDNKIKINPDYANKETIGLLNQNLEDFSISRQKVKWGIDLPFDEKQTVYVWVDALLNYISAIGYGDNDEQFKEWWTDSRTIHLLAKDILKFHAIFWPALLLAGGEKTPDSEFIHGFFTINGQKMSKTLGNVIDPNDLIKQFGVDATRYLLLSQFPFGQDGDIKQEKFIEKYNSDLANGLGNLVARVVTLLAKTENVGTEIDSKVKEVLKSAKDNCNKSMENFEIYEALGEIWKIISFCDGYINETKPWVLVKEDLEKFNGVISNLVYAISEISNLISPFLPETSERIKNQIKEKKSEILFPRI